MRAILLAFLCQLSTLAAAQLTGKVTLEHFGIEFTIPDGWVGQETEMGYILGSHTEAGAIFLSGHESTTLEHLRAEAMRGIYEEGIQLSLQGMPEQLTPNSLGGTYAGLLQGQPVKAYGVGLINPHGKGVSVIALTTPQLFTDRYPQLAKEIAGNIRFSKAKTLPIIEEWRQALTRARLTYMDSYSTQGGGYNDKVVIDLCPGYFLHSRNFNLGADVGGAFGSANSSGQGSGTWQVVPDVSGNAVLELLFNNGERREYTLQFVNDRTLLNGTRYFRTYDANCQ